MRNIKALRPRCVPLSSTWEIVDVIFSYTSCNSDLMEKFCVRVDATEEFPFLVTKLSPYHDRWTKGAPHTGDWT